MKWLRTATAVLLVALWVPASSHCLLEAAGFLDPDPCCADFDENCPHTHDCDGLCRTISSSSVCVPDNQLSLLLSPLAWLSFADDVTTDQTPPPPTTRIAESLSPPELSHAWQFFTRAAPPIRAPSFAA